MIKYVYYEGQTPDVKKNGKMNRLTYENGIVVADEFMPDGIPKDELNPEIIDSFTKDHPDHPVNQKPAETHIHNEDRGKK